ncbi:MAG: hypothetical protein ACR2MU_08775 [Gaiellaceae bacterium]
MALPPTSARKRLAARRILEADRMPVPSTADLRTELDELRGRRA